MIKYIRFLKRKRILYEFGFYYGLSGCFVHPHSMSYFTKKEVYNMADEDFIKAIQ